RDLAGGGGALAIVEGEREEVLLGLRLGGGDRHEDDRVAVAHQHRPVGLPGEEPGLDRQLLAADLTLDRDRRVEVSRSVRPVAPVGTVRRPGCRVGVHASTAFLLPAGSDRRWSRPVWMKRSDGGPRCPAWTRSIPASARPRREMNRGTGIAPTCRRWFARASCTRDRAQPARNPRRLTTWSKRWGLLAFRYFRSVFRLPTIIKRPRRAAKSFLWSLKCSVSCLIRSDRSAIWTSGEPVSPSR